MDFAIDLDTFIISDTHFRHKNIIKYCNRPMHHDLLMEANWHELVGKDDLVLHLGDLQIWYNDLLMREADRISERLPGKKYLLRGNHDHYTDEEFALLGFTVIPEFIQTFGQTRVLFSHYPDTSRGHLWDLNIHGHIHNNQSRDHQNLDRKWINVSIEVMDYKPVRLRDVLK